MPNMPYTYPKRNNMDNFRTLVVGWEQTSKNSPSSHTLPRTNLSPSSKSLREAFFLEPTYNNSRAEITSPSSPNSGHMPSHRYASVERLSQRQNFYDTSQPLTAVTATFNTASPITALNTNTSPEPVEIKTKRELLFPQISNSPSGDMADAITSARDYSFQRNRYLGNKDSDLNAAREKSTSLTRDNETCVGFSNIPNQIHRRTFKKGFEFTIMVVGESGLGKSTAINSLFLSDVYSDEYPGPSKRMTKTVEVETTKVNIKENDVNLALTIVDTPGFGCAVDNSNNWQKISEYIENRYEDYLSAETKLHRTDITDDRVHVCLYFISPGHSLKAIDLEFLSNLHEKVNIIPIIAKADTMTADECIHFKKSVMNEINQHNIKIYQFPDCDDEKEAKLLKQLRSRVPFAICGSNEVIEINGEPKRARKYPWGVVEVENLEHCDLAALRLLLIKYYMLDLVDTTNNVHYENYRCRKLSGMGVDKANDNKNPLAQMEEEKKLFQSRMLQLEEDLKQIFNTKVDEKLNKIKESEADLARRTEQTNDALKSQRQELEEQRAAFKKEREAFELVKKEVEEMRKSTLEASSRESQPFRRSTLNVSKKFTLGSKFIKKFRDT